MSDKLKASNRRIFFEKEQVIKTKIKGYIDVEIDYTQIYHNIFLYIKDIQDKWSIKYLFWVLPKANEDNMIPHGDNVIIDFINNFDEKPSVKTVRDAISVLVKHKILLKHGYGQYQLNPYVIWGENTNLRKEHLVGLEKFGFKKDDFNLIENDVKDLKEGEYKLIDTSTNNTNNGNQLEQQQN